MLNPSFVMSPSVTREIPRPLVGDAGGTSLTDELEALCELPPIRDVQGGIIIIIESSTAFDTLSMLKSRSHELSLCSS